MLEQFNKQNKTRCISTGYTNVKTGIGFALFIKQFFGSFFLIMLTIIIVSGCVMPADIRTRPDGDLEDDSDYWPIIINPQPSAGIVKLNPQCADYPNYKNFRFLMATELSPNDELRQEKFETRWFINDEQIRSDVGYSDVIGLPFFLIESNCNVDETSENYYCLVEAHVSDLGFKEDTGYLPAEGAHYTSIYWFVNFDNSTPCE